MRALPMLCLGLLACGDDAPAHDSSRGAELEIDAAATETVANETVASDTTIDETAVGETSVEDSATVDATPLACTPTALTADATSDVFHSAELPDVDIACLATVIPDPGALALTLRPTTSGVYRVDVKAVDGSSHPESIWLVSDCDALCDGTQVGHGVALEADHDYTFVVVATRDPAFDFRVAVSAPCIPDCDGKACGSDGCGQTCGACASSDVCELAAGACHDTDIPGQTCANAVEVDTGVLATASWQHRIPKLLTRDDLALDCVPDTTGYADIVYRLTPTATARYTIFASGDGVVTTDCTSACDAPVALLESFAQNGVDLVADTTYAIIINGWRRDDAFMSEETIIRIDPPCFPSCEGATCGSDGCGGSCGTCDGANGQECDETARICAPVADVCNSGSNACDVEAYVCDPGACVADPCASCFYRVCEPTELGLQWHPYEHYPPSTCAYATCPELPIEMHFDYSPDFTRHDAYLAIDPLTAQCDGSAPEALHFGGNTDHDSFVVGLNGWHIIAADGGTFYPNTGGGTLLDVPTTPTTVTVRADSGVEVDVTFTWGGTLVFSAIAFHVD